MVNGHSRASGDVASMVAAAAADEVSAKDGRQVYIVCSTPKLSAGDVVARIEVIRARGGDPAARAAVLWQNERANNASPLHKAAANDKSPAADAVCALLRCLNEDDDVNVATDSGRTPLHYACEYGNDNPAVVRALLARGGRSSQRNKDGETPVNMALRKLHTASMRVFTRHQQAPFTAADVPEAFTDISFRSAAAAYEVSSAADADREDAELQRACRTLRGALRAQSRERARLVGAQAKWRDGPSRRAVALVSDFESLSKAIEDIDAMDEAKERAESATDTASADGRSSASSGAGSADGTASAGASASAGGGDGRASAAQSADLEGEFASDASDDEVGEVGPLTRAAQRLRILENDRSTLDAIQVQIRTRAREIVVDPAWARKVSALSSARDSTAGGGAHPSAAKRLRAALADKTLATLIGCRSTAARTAAARMKAAVNAVVDRREALQGHVDSITTLMAEFFHTAGESVEKAVGEEPRPGSPRVVAHGGHDRRGGGSVSSPGDRAEVHLEGSGDLLSRFSKADTGAGAAARGAMKDLSDAIGDFVRDAREAEDDSGEPSDAAGISALTPAGSPRGGPNDATTTALRALYAASDSLSAASDSVADAVRAPINVGDILGPGLGHGPRLGDNPLVSGVEADEDEFLGGDPVAEASEHVRVCAAHVVVAAVEERRRLEAANSALDVAMMALAKQAKTTETAVLHLIDVETAACDAELAEYASRLPVIESLVLADNMDSNTSTRRRWEGLDGGDDEDSRDPRVQVCVDIAAAQEKLVDAECAMTDAVGAMVNERKRLSIKRSTASRVAQAQRDFKKTEEAARAAADALAEAQGRMETLAVQSYPEMDVVAADELPRSPRGGGDSGGGDSGGGGSSSGDVA